MLFFLYKSAYYDFKNKEIYDKYTVPILILGLLHIYNLPNMAYITLFMISLRYIGALLFNKEVFGEADIIIYVGLAGFYSISNIIGIYILSTFLALFYALFLKFNKKENWDQIPMIPMILLSIPFIELGLVKIVLKFLN